MGRPRDPEYWKKWRARHPAYREREKQRSKNRIRSSSGRDYKKEYSQRSKRLAEVDIFTDPIILAARYGVKQIIREDTRDSIYDPLFEDAVSEWLLAVTLREEPVERVKAWLKAERKYRWRELNFTGNRTEMLPFYDL